MYENDSMKLPIDLAKGNLELATGLCSYVERVIGYLGSIIGSRLIFTRGYVNSKGRALGSHYYSNSRSNEILSHGLNSMSL